MALGEPILRSLEDLATITSFVKEVRNRKVVMSQVKSRAMEFCEQAARTCIERATASNCTSPVLYLRRAADLSATLPQPVPGQTTSSSPSQYCLNLTAVDRLHEPHALVFMRHLLPLHDTNLYCAYI